jgi:hypothetical protein
MNDRPTHRGTVGRRASTLLAVVAMVLALLTGIGVQQAAAATACHPYPDVTSSNPHCGNITWLKGQGITKPADGYYHPLDGVTRGSMTAFLFRLLNPGRNQPACTSRPFPDVPVTSTFCGYIKWAKNSGIAYGYSNGTYGPANPVTRGAMAAYLYRIANPGKAAKKCTSKPFTDVGVDDTFCAVITWMVTNGITYGVGGGKYGTTLPVTRQAMASFLHRIFSTPAVLRRAAPPVWAPTGSAQTIKGVSFLAPSGWTVQRGTDGIGVTSPKDSHGDECQLVVLAPQPAATTQAGRFQQAADIASALPVDTLTNPDGGADLQADAFQGSTGNGWDYTGLALAATAGGQDHSVLSILARFGSQVVPLLVLAEDSPFGNGWDCVGDDGAFGANVATVFYTLSLGVAKPNASLATKVLGDWFSSSGSVGNGYTYGRNSRYVHASVYGGVVWDNYGNWQDVYATWSGDGSWAATGDLLAYFPTGQSAYSEYTRVFQRKVDGAWRTTLCSIAEAEGKPYSYCTNPA